MPTDVAEASNQKTGKPAEMATYVARVMDAETGGEGTYEFQAPRKLIKKSPIRAIKAFMEHADHNIVTGHHIDYHINAAFNNREKRVITGMGSLIATDESEMPFVLLITRKD